MTNGKQGIRSSLGPGSRIGEYEILATLGSGGMGTVCAARHTRSGAEVALKFIKDELYEADLPQRLLREAEATAAVQHPNVVEIREVVMLEDGTPMIVMELLRGETLRDVIRRKGRLSVERTARYLVPVASAVAQAHEAGIVHRDLKPDNILLSRNAAGACVVKVLDFGIAKLTQSHNGVCLTGTGEVLGTPSYMSPEQIFGESDLDQRADVWSLGVILYECLAGLPPTNATKVGQVVKLIMSGGIKPLDAVAPCTPPDIVALVSRMLTLKRERRIADLRQVAEELSLYCPSAELDSWDSCRRLRLETEAETVQPRARESA
jgi:eukaryotic-like serine/threonine-protein kinase